MDNRRLSARADTGAASPYVRPTGAPTQWLDRAIDLTKANWEVLLYVGLMIVAVLTRVWDLGPRALHHDESIHAYYSSQYLKGGGYNYDPTYHGSFLYHIVGLGYFLFGTTDAMARIMPAFFGVALVGMCWLLRPFMGRISAMIAVLLITLSPTIAYYSRSLRHDIFALAGLMALFVSILWFLRTHEARWVYIGTVGFTIALTSHELTYIVVLLFVLYLALGYFGFRVLAGRSQYGSRTWRAGDDVNPVGSAFQSLNRQRWTVAGAALTFLAIFTLLYTNFLTKFFYASESFRPRNPDGTPVPNTSAPMLPFITALIEGPWYWATQHQVARGNQPNWYYLMTLTIYEALAFFGGIITSIFLLINGLLGRGTALAPVEETDVDTKGDFDQYGVALPSITTLRTFTLGFLVFWSFGALVAFSWAGERLPWLTMQSALPFTLLVSAGLGRLITMMDWRAVWKGGGAFVGVAVLLFLFAAFNLMHHLNGTMPQASGQGAGLQNGLRGALLFLFTFGLLALAAWLAYRMMPGRATAVVAVTFAVVLGLYGLRSMMLLNYRHGDVPVEMMVYTQSGPDVPEVADVIKRLSRDETAFDSRNAQDVTGGRSLQISIDQSVEWPFDWYLRDMRSISYYNSGQWASKQANVVPANAPVIIASDESKADPNFQSFVASNYVSQTYVLRWWFPEELYKTDNVGDLGKAWAWMTGPAFTRYLLYRDTGLPLGSTNFTLLVRNDLGPKTGLSAPNITNVPPANPPPDEVTSTTKINLFAGGPAGRQNGQLSGPRGIAQDAAGNFYVVDTANFRVQKYDKDGNYLAKTSGGKGSGDCQFNPINESSTDTGPSGIAVDKAGNLYVADVWNHRIQKLDKDLKCVAKWGSFISLADSGANEDGGRDMKMYGPRGVAAGPDGNVYVTDTGNKRVLIYSPEGKFLRKIDSGMSPAKKSPDYPFTKPGELNEPIGIAVDASGNVYVADTNNRRIQKFDNTGKFVSTLNPPSGAFDQGQEPFLAVDSAGNVYLSGPGGSAVYKFNSSGQLQGQKSKNGASTLKKPSGIAVGPDGAIYVMDISQNTAVNLGTIP